MEYYLTPDATTYYNFIDEAIAIVDHQIQKGFVPWLLSSMGRSSDIYNRFDLPIFFVSENDLGKAVNHVNLSAVSHRTILPPSSLRAPSDQLSTYPKPWYSTEPKLIAGTSIHNDREKATDIPEVIYVPSEGDFEFEDNEVPHENQSTELNPENKEIYIERGRSSDWIGLYYRYNTPLRCIFIRIQKILEATSINDSHGVASVLLHELAHAIFDVKTRSLHFKTPVAHRIADSLYYHVEEAMANLFAYRALRSLTCTVRQLRYIFDFMLTQPFPYALGARIGDARCLPGRNLDFVLKSYIVKWYKAKCGVLLIDNWKAWINQVSLRNFTDCNIIQQHQTLFSK